MLRLFRKWFLVRRLKRECFSHVTKEHNPEEFIARGDKIVVSKAHFARLAASGHLWMRFWDKNYRAWKQEEFSSIVESCVSQGLILEDSNGGIRTSTAGDDFCSFWDLMEAFFSRYRSPWTMVIVPIITFVFGFFFSPSVVSSIRQTKSSQQAGQVNTKQEKPEEPISQNVPKKNDKDYPRTSLEQDGRGSGAVGGGVTTGPCSNVQVGGNGNRQSVNCAPPIRVLTDVQKQGVTDFLKTVPASVLVTIGSVYGSGDGDNYAQQFFPLFAGRHLDNESSPKLRTGFPMSWTGVFVATTTDNDSAAPYRDAFVRQLNRLGIVAHGANGSRNVTSGNIDFLIGYRPEEVKP